MTEGLRLLTEVPLFENDDPRSICINSILPFNVPDLGVVSFTSNEGGSYPFVVSVNDLMTGTETILSEFGNSVTILKNRIYFIEVTPLAVGAGEVTFTPNPTLAALDIAQTEVYDVEVLADLPLPVTWSSPLTFSATKETYKFSWGVSDQIDVATYNLQTSTENGFETIVTTYPRFSNSDEVLYEISSTARVENAFYRISQLDVDGAESISNMVFIPGRATENRLTVYPNPAKDELRLKHVSAGVTSARLLSATGSTVRYFVQVNNDQPLDVSGLKPGIYTLRLLGDTAAIKNVRVVIE